MKAQNSPLIGDVLNRAADRMDAAGLFFGHGTDNAWDEACLLLFAVLDLPPDIDDSIACEAFPGAALEQFEQLLERRISERIPMAYLVEKVWYAGYAFLVNSHVLVPRSPLAELIQRQFRPWLREPPARVLDLCAGSGCLGILCAHEYPGAEVTLGELSADALEVARRNIALHELGDRVHCVQSDLFTQLEPARFDLILSNPPYVDAADMHDLPAEFRKEPELGLASGEDGLDITRAILAQAADWLSEEGILVVEVGNSWAALERTYPSVPFTWVELEQGGHGIFILTRAELLEFSDSFADAYNRGADSQG